MFSRNQLPINVTLMFLIAGAVALSGCEGRVPAPPVALRIGVFQSQDLLSYYVMQEQGFAKKYGLSFQETSYPGAAMEARLKQEGIGAYSYVETLGANLGLAVAGGNMAAAAMVEPYVTQSLLRGDGKLLDWVVGGPPLERTAFTSIVFSAEFRSSKPDGVKAFLRAHLAAAKWINDHPDAARLVLAKRMQLSHEVARKVNLLHWPLDARSDPALLEQTRQALLRAGILKRPVGASQLHDETLLAEVLKEAR